MENSIDINFSAADFQQLKINNTNIFQNTFLNTEELMQLRDSFLKSFTAEQTSRFLNALISKDIFIEIFNSIQDGIQIIDNSGTIIYVNPAFLDILGVKREDRIGKNIMEVSPDGSLAAILKTKSPVSNLMNSPKGSSTELISNAVPIKINGHMIGAVAFVKDIRKVIALTEELKLSLDMIMSLSEKLRHLSDAAYSFEDVIGNSTAIQNVIVMAKIAAQNNSVVLLQGETGTGKEVIANAIHKASSRCRKPFISVNCSAVSKNLMESEFFGHEKGSFTGAYKRQLGKFELANGGTLFLDEIGDMDITLQAKILRAIEEKEIQRVGGSSDIPLDVRIIAATNRDLKKMIEEETFREDLYYRLNVWNIIIPPLRERKEDIEALSNFFLDKISRRIGKRKIFISEKALDILCRHSWPGNVRELQNTLERAALNVKSGIIEAEDLAFLTINDTAAAEGNMFTTLKEMEKRTIQKALKHYGDSYEAKIEIAKVLGISLASLYNKLKKYKIC